jgi:hypothetical protein
MKITKVLMPCLLILAAVVSKAQSTSEITDDELKKYAVTMDSVAAMQQSLRELVAEAVRSNTAMPVARYNQLIKVQQDSAKLKATASAAEIAFLKQINDLRKVNIGRINATYQDLAKNYVGLKTFNQIRKSLQSDQQLKARYDNLAKDTESKQKGG